jgi:hypothetical protein
MSAAHFVSVDARSANPCANTSTASAAPTGAPILILESLDRLTAIPSAGIAGASAIGQRFP